VRREMVMGRSLKTLEDAAPPPVPGSWATAAQKGLAPDHAAGGAAAWQRLDVVNARTGLRSEGAGVAGAEASSTQKGGDLMPGATTSA